VESIMAKNVNNELLHRKSIRLKGYDYSREGLYFITICVNERKHLFGKIVGASLCGCPMMILNDAGMMVEKRYWELENKFLNQKCCEMVIMPNHFHCIIELNGQPQNGQPQGIAPTGKTVGDIIGAFKSITTNEYIRGVKNLNWEPFNNRLWQRNYWEHIIRDEKSYNKISEYIKNNPINWNIDKLNNIVGAPLVGALLTQPQNVQAETNGRSQTNGRPSCPAVNESTDDYNNEPWMV